MIDAQSAVEELGKDREAIAKYQRMLDDPQLDLSPTDRQRYQTLIGWYEEHAQMMERIIAAYAPA